MISRVPERIRDNIPKSVAIVGVGGVGSWMAMLFSQIKEVERIGLFDEDLIEESNLERTWFKIKDLNEKKSVAMKEQILNRRTDINVLTYGHLTNENKQLLNLYDLKVVCADNRDIRNMVLEFDNSISTGYDVDEEKDWISVSEQQMWSVFGDAEEDEYTIEPSWGVPAMLGALITVHSVIMGKRPANISAKINDFYKIGVNDHKIFSIYSDEEEEIKKDEDESETSFSFDDVREEYQYADIKIDEITENTIECPDCHIEVLLKRRCDYDSTYTYNGEDKHFVCPKCDHVYTEDFMREELKLLPEYDELKCINCEEKMLIKQDDAYGCMNCKKVFSEDEIKEFYGSFPFEMFYDEYIYAGFSLQNVVEDFIDEIECPICGEETLIYYPSDGDIFCECCEDFAQYIAEFEERLIEDNMIPDYETQVCSKCGEKTVVKHDNKLGCLNCKTIMSDDYEIIVNSDGDRIMSDSRWTFDIGDD